MLRKCCLTVLLALPLAGPVLLSGAPAPAPRPRPTLTLLEAEPPYTRGGPQRFIFKGSSSVSIHRPGPEHFKLTRADNGKEVRLLIAYERRDLPKGPPPPRQRVRLLTAAREGATKYPYNTLFKGVKLYLDTGEYDGKDYARRWDYPDLHARAKLEPGVRYCLTWACWQVGAPAAAEVSCPVALTK